jgi:hypothetical protein
MALTNIRTEMARRISPPASRGEVSEIIVVISAFFCSALLMTKHRGRNNVPARVGNWLSEAEANRLAALRRYGESYSEAVIRMAKEAAKD